MRIRINKQILLIPIMILLLAPMTAKAQKPLKRKEKTEQNGGKPNGHNGKKPSRTGNGRQGASSTSQSQSIVTTGTLDLGYGTWEGGIKNGKPDGKGRITYTANHAVDRSTSYQANPGDYFEANFDCGSLISGKLYDSAGILLKTIIP